MIHSISELLFTVPVNLISGHLYWWMAAMNGEFGPVAAALISLFGFVLWMYGIMATFMR